MEGRGGGGGGGGRRAWMHVAVCNTLAAVCSITVLMIRALTGHGERKLWKLFWPKLARDAKCDAGKGGEASQGSHPDVHPLAFHRVPGRLSLLLVLVWRVYRMNV